MSVPGLKQAKRIKRILLGTLTGMLFAVAPATAQDSGFLRDSGDPAFLTFGAGVYDISESDNSSGVFRFEYRHDKRFWYVKPFIGLEINTDQAFYGYFGLGTDLYFGKRWVLFPSAAVGGFSNGNSRDMGHALEFRTGAELAYRFDDYSRIGLSVHHISNANIGEKNPGVENILINYSIPFSKVMNWLP